MPADLPPDELTATPGRHAAWLLVGGVMLASVGLSLGLIAATTPTAPDAAGADRSPSTIGAEATPSPRPTETAPPAQSPAEPGELSSATAKSVLTGFLKGVSVTSADPADGLADLEGLATGAILAELENDRLELEDNGWTRTGADSVVSLEVTSFQPNAQPQTATVAACIDSSAVALLDAAGKPIASGSGEKRSVNIYTLVLEEGAWRVADRTFPDEAAC